MVRTVGGSEPEDFETITRRYIAATPITRRSLKNKVQVLIDLMKMMLTRTPDIEAYELSQGHPLLRDSKYGVEYEPWLTPHSSENAYSLNSTFNEWHTQTRNMVLATAPLQ